MMNIFHSSWYRTTAHSSLHYMECPVSHSVKLLNDAHWLNFLVCLFISFSPRLTEFIWGNIINILYCIFCTMTWRREEPRHQQSWYWLSLSGIFQFQQQKALRIYVIYLPCKGQSVCHIRICLWLSNQSILSIMITVYWMRHHFHE